MKLRKLKTGRPLRTYHTSRLTNPSPSSESYEYGTGIGGASLNSRLVRGTAGRRAPQLGRPTTDRSLNLRQSGGKYFGMSVLELWWSGFADGVENKSRLEF